MRVRERIRRPVVPAIDPFGWLRARMRLSLEAVAGVEGMARVLSGRVWSDTLPCRIVREDTAGDWGEFMCLTVRAGRADDAIDIERLAAMRWGAS